MTMHEEVALHPRVRAVEIEDVVIGANEHVVDELGDWPGPVAAGEIDDVIVTNRNAEIIAEEQPSSAAFDSTGAVH